MPLISLDNVSKSFVLGSQTIFALKQLSLQVQRGDMLAITGPSGSGKTTLMTVMGLLDKVDQGHYYLNGQEVSNADDITLSSLRNRSIGFIFQHFYLLPKFNALYNVALPLLYRHLSVQEASERALVALQQVGMEAFAERLPSQLSGGQQQRVAIARALVGDPDVILADEPTGALDSLTSEDIMQRLSSLHKAGRTIIIVTHDQRIAERCAKHMVMRDGELLSQSWS